MGVSASQPEYQRSVDGLSRGTRGSLRELLLPLFLPLPLQDLPRELLSATDNRVELGTLPLPPHSFLLLFLLLHPLLREETDSAGVETFPRQEGQGLQRRRAPTALRVKAASTHRASGSFKTPGRPWRWSVLCPGAAVHYVLHLLFRLLHHRPRGLCTVVESRRQLNGNRQHVRHPRRPLEFHRKRLTQQLT